MVIELLKSIRFPLYMSPGIQADKDSGYCFACGAQSNFGYAEIINDDLARQWKVNKKDRHAFSSRESRQCQKCGATYRNRQVARALCSEYKQFKSMNAIELIENENFKKLKIAEINAVGGLHQFLIRHPHMHYSEFEPEDKAINHEDLHSLSYKDNSFDLVITSETLEHVPNYNQALREIYRVLKPGGKHLFTIPVIWQRQTRRRAALDDKSKKIKYILQPSYHGLAHDDNLVWTEFGYDILNELNAIGYKTKIIYFNVLNHHDASCVFISSKIE